MANKRKRQRSFNKVGKSHNEYIGRQLMVQPDGE
jgi:hypothetical protein